MSDTSYRNKKIEMFHRNWQLADYNIMMVAEYLQLNGFLKTEEIFLVESGSHMRRAIHEGLPNDNKLTRLVASQMSNPEAQFVNYMPGLLQKLKWDPSDFVEEEQKKRKSKREKIKKFVRTIPKLLKKK